MAKVTVIGAAGRMGRRLVTNILSTPGMSLAGAVSIPLPNFSAATLRLSQVFPLAE